MMTCVSYVCKQVYRIRTTSKTPLAEAQTALEKQKNAFCGTRV